MSSIRIPIADFISDTRKFIKMASEGQPSEAILCNNEIIQVKLKEKLKEKTF